MGTKGKPEPFGSPIVPVSCFANLAKAEVESSVSVTLGSQDTSSASSNFVDEGSVYECSSDHSTSSSDVSVLLSSNESKPARVVYSRFSMCEMLD